MELHFSHSSCFGQKHLTPDEGTAFRMTLFFSQRWEGERAATASLWNLKREDALPDRFSFSQSDGSQPGWPSCSQDMGRPACPAACPASARQPAKCHSRELAVPQPSGTAEPGSSSWMLKVRPPKEAVINRRAQGICSGFTLAGKPGEHPRGPQRNACQEPVTYHAVFEGGR